MWVGEEVRGMYTPVQSVEAVAAGDWAEAGVGVPPVVHLAVASIGTMSCN